MLELKKQEKKMATFFNQASLSFNGRITNSNVTTGELVETATASKTAIIGEYRANGTVSYLINLVNNGQTALTGVTISDNLGAYTLADGVTTVYPLEYLDGSARLFVNGVLVAAPTVSAGPPLVLSGITVPPSSNAYIVYEANVTEYAPLESGSTITNTATVNGIQPTEVEISATTSADEYTELTIAKAICPATVTDNSELTYTFIIQNSGNTPVEFSDNILISDTFAPILNPITVTYNGFAWTEGVNYTYDETTGAFASTAEQISVPAATYTQDPATGVITVTPGVTVITVTGTV